jgi:hypothetical protein
LCQSFEKHFQIKDPLSVVVYLKEKMREKGGSLFFVWIREKGSSIGLRRISHFGFWNSDRSCCMAYLSESLLYCVLSPQEQTKEEGENKKKTSFVGGSIFLLLPHPKTLSFPFINSFLIYLLKGKKKNLLCD